jgi:hypothetical protein
MLAVWALAVTLTLPHVPRAGETASLDVTLGVIPRGAEIDVTTPSGRSLGTISPYGIRSGEEAGTYSVPVPRDAINGKCVPLLLNLVFNGETRTPTKREVKKLRVVVRPAK